MNKERILALADLIEPMEHTSVNDKAGFNMNSFDHSCGTPSCIAGWAAWESLGRPDKFGANRKDIQRIASEYLGVFYDDKDEVSSSLFWADDIDLETITPAQAVRTLRHLAETGEVVWEPSEVPE